MLIARTCLDRMARLSPIWRETFWRILKGTRLATAFDLSDYLKLKLLGATGERFASPEDGGGINSLIIAQELYWKSDIPRICCDKWAVREFVRSRGLGDILVPLVPAETSWEDADRIPFENLPERFVLKCNNGSGLLRIVRDKGKEDLAALRRTAAGWLRTDFGTNGHERQYIGMHNRLFAEDLLDDGTGKVPVDYKIMCSNGRPLYAWVDTGRFVDHRRTVFDLQFNWQDVRIGFPGDAGTPSRPDNWERMLEIAAELSRGIPIVRIDLYNLSGRIFFGEMTFTSDRANAITTPFEFSNRMARQADPMVRSLFAAEGAGQ